MKTLLDKLIIEALKTKKTMDEAELSSSLYAVPSLIKKSIERLTGEGFLAEQLYSGHKRYKLVKKQLEETFNYQQELNIVLEEVNNLRDKNGTLKEFLILLKKLDEAGIDLNKHNMSLFK